MKSLIFILLALSSFELRASCMLPLQDGVVKFDVEQLEGLPSGVVKVTATYPEEVDGWPVSHVGLNYSVEHGRHLIQTNLPRNQVGKILSSEFVYNREHLTSTTLSIIYQSSDSECGKIITYGGVNA